MRIEQEGTQASTEYSSLSAMQKKQDDWSSSVTKSQVFEYAKDGPIRSLATDLRMRREVKERLSIERMKYETALNEMPTPMSIRQAAKETMQRRLALLPT